MVDPLLIDIRPPIAWLSLNRPEKLNAITGEMLARLLEAAEEIERDDEVRVAVLSGQGRAFSAGGDIGDMEAMDRPTFASTIALYMRVAAAFRASSKPIIAAIHGHALAGGFELALLCDLRIAAEGTRFGLPDAALGLSPTSGMTYLLPRVIGLGRALHLTLSGDHIEADEALRIGLLAKVVAAERLMSAAEDYALRIASYPRIGVATTKARFYDALESDFATATAREHEGELRCFDSAEVKQRFREFLDRRSKPAPHSK